jgi:hypothetical protein
MGDEDLFQEGGKRNFTCKAIEDCELLVLNEKDILRVFSENPGAKHFRRLIKEAKLKKTTLEELKDKALNNSLNPKKIQTQGEMIAKNKKELEREEEEREKEEKEKEKEGSVEPNFLQNMMEKINYLVQDAQGEGSAIEDEEVQSEPELSASNLKLAKAPTLKETKYQPNIFPFYRPPKRTKSSKYKRHWFNKRTEALFYPSSTSLSPRTHSSMHKLPTIRKLSGKISGGSSFLPKPDLNTILTVRKSLKHFK